LKYSQGITMRHRGEQDFLISSLFCIEDCCVKVYNLTGPITASDFRFSTEELASWTSSIIVSNKQAYQGAIYWFKAFALASLSALVPSSLISASFGG
jgi:hypothetical protein